jgi:uncharacterized protein involved in exopolysaccharide biosynthesis
LRELVRRIARRRWLLAGVFTGVFALVVVYTFAVTPRYESVARLRIQTESPGASALADQMTAGVPGASILGLGRDELETEVGVLRSDRVRDAAIDSLALNIQVKSPAGERARILTAHVVDPLIDVDGTLTLTQTQPGRYRVEKDKLEEVRTLPASIAAGDSMRVGGTEITLSPQLRPGGPEKIVIRVLPRFEVHKLLDRRLTIERQEGGSRLVEVAYEDPDRVLAAQVVQRVIAEYVAYSNRITEAQDTTTVVQLRREVDSTGRRLAQSEMALRSFEEQSRLIAPEEQASAQVKRISAISARVDAISVERNALAKMLTIIQQRSRGGEDASAYRQLATFPSLISNRAIQDLLQSLVDLENKRAQLGVTRTAENPEYKQLTDRISEIEHQLYSVGPQYLESLDQELATTVHTVTALNDTLQALPAAATRFGQLVRDRTILEATYAALQKQLKQAELADVLRQEKVHVVDAPRVANREDPAFPNKPVMIALGLVLGVALAVTVGLGVELFATP